MQGQRIKTYNSIYNKELTKDCAEGPLYHKSLFYKNLLVLMRWPCDMSRVVPRKKLTIEEPVCHVKF
jgi:hypothetical protein